MPRCLEWGYVPVDAGTPSTSSIDGTDVLEPDAGEVDAGEVDADAGSSMRRVCKRYGYLNESGCSAVAGAPVVSGAALVLALMLARRRSRRAVH